MAINEFFNLRNIPMLASLLGSIFTGKTNFGRATSLVVGAAGWLFLLYIGLGTVGRLAAASPVEATRDAEAKARADAIRQTLVMLEQELQECGGSWEAWAKSLEPYREELRAILPTPWPWPAKHGYVFQGRAIELILTDDLDQKPDGERPFDAIVHLDRQLKERGIDLILMLVPSKLGIYPDYLSDKAPAHRNVSLAVKRLEKKLLEHDVEVIDLFTPFREFRREKGDEVPLYYVKDSHWLNRGARLAADQIAERLKRYECVRRALAAGNPYVGKPTSRSDGTKADHDIITVVHQATQRNYNDVPNSPIVLTGDSYSMYNMTHGHLSAQVALRIGMPLTLMCSQGLSSGMPAELAAAEKRNGYLRGRRVIVWTFTERSLLTRGKEWQLVNLPPPSTTSPKPEKPEAVVKDLLASGVVVESSLPPEKNANYAHYIMRFYVKDLVDANGQKVGPGDGIVRILAMRDREHLPVVNTKPGDRLKLRLTAWSQVRAQYGRIESRPIETAQLEAEKPHYWGVVVDDEGKPLPGSQIDKPLVVTVEEVEPAALDSANAVWQVVLEKVLPQGKAAQLWLSTAGGQWKQAICLTPDYNHGLHELDVSALRLAGEKLSGTVKFTINPDGWIPPDRKPLVCAFRVEAEARNAAVAGSYEGRAGEAESRGNISGKLSPATEAMKTGRLNLRLENALTGGQRHVCTAHLLLPLVDGKVRGGQIGWKGFNPYFWSGNLDSASLQLTEDSLTGELQATVTSQRGAVTPGTYRFTLKGKVVDKVVVGTFTTSLAERQLGEGAFSGTLEPRRP
jgi:hypothetical protein